MILALDIVAITLILVGALFCLAAALGLARFRDTVSRMHASSKPQTLGLLLAMLGTFLHVVVHSEGGATVYGDLGLLLLIAAFAVVTSPVIGNRLSHVSLQEGLIDREHLSRDDLADK
ncbi:monovalent cation/H(+) antiporter subunit G [Corynebacterium sp. H78]|uniref:monovalent cation/H(+) antiporter subunit G n=1 Tax=Corynebacterium sp. H78 TaxID=3133417 RepID=UPI00309BE654